MAKRNARTLAARRAVAEERARLVELRALLGRIGERRLEGDDWAVVETLLAAELDQAESEEGGIARSDEEDGSDSEGKTEAEQVPQ